MHHQVVTILLNRAKFPTKYMAFSREIYSRKNATIVLKIAFYSSVANAAGGRVCMEKCYIRYENYSFIGKLDTRSAPVYYNGNKAANPESFSRSVLGLLKNLSDKAPLLEKRFETGSTTGSWSDIYGLVQCWRDISTGDCRLCLKSAISGLLEVTNATILGGVCLLGSCSARYEKNPFFNEIASSPVPSLPPASVDAPTASFPSRDTRPTAATPNKSSNKTALVGGVVGGLLVTLLVGRSHLCKAEKIQGSCVWKANQPRRRRA